MKREKAPSDHVEVFGAKYAHMLLLAKHLDLLVPTKNIALTPITVVPTMLCIFFHAKHVLDNTQVVQKVLDLHLLIIRQPIKISPKGIPSSKHYFTLTLRMTNIMV